MLFPYKPLKDHKFEKLQGFIKCIFYDAWCKAPNVQYSLELYKSNADLYNILMDINNCDSAGNVKAKEFLVNLNQIFDEFKKLSNKEVEQYKLYFKFNNDVENLCCGDESCQPRRYERNQAAKTTLDEKLELFFKNLYSTGFIGHKRTQNIIGTKSEYYDDLINENNNGICPFCGLLPLDNENDPSRDAFDHYLPKSKYPFNSVNIKNLFPSCDKCNSKNKGSDDPIYDRDTTKRRKAFYPFDQNNKNIEISIEVSTNSWSEIKPNDLTVSLKSTSNPEEVNTWNDLYRVKQRYFAKCSSNAGYKYWLERIFVESVNYNTTPRNMFNGERQSAEINPWNDVNFLKKAFLEGCSKAGLFDNL